MLGDTPATAAATAATQITQTPSIEWVCCTSLDAAVHVVTPNDLVTPVVEGTGRK